MSILGAASPRRGSLPEVGPARAGEPLRAAIASRRYLVGDRFTYADVTMAVTLQFVAPPSDAYLPLGPATRASCADPELAAHAAELLEWRDELYRTTPPTAARSIVTARSGLVRRSSSRRPP